MEKDLWDKPEAKYMQKSVENKLNLKKKLSYFDYKKGISMAEHLDDFNKIITDWLNLDVIIDDEDKTLLLLNCLWKSYEYFDGVVITHAGAIWILGTLRTSIIVN